MTCDLPAAVRAAEMQQQAPKPKASRHPGLFVDGASWSRRHERHGTGRSPADRSAAPCCGSRDRQQALDACSRALPTPRDPRRRASRTWQADRRHRGRACSAPMGRTAATAAKGSARRRSRERGSRQSSKGCWRRKGGSACLLYVRRHGIYECPARYKPIVAESWPPGVRQDQGLQMPIVSPSIGTKEIPPRSNANRSCASVARCTSCRWPS